MVVIPAEAGIHCRVAQKGKMDSRFRGNDVEVVVETLSNFFFNRTTA